MKLQTEIPLNPEENQIDYSSKVLLVGSCFSENIGAKFDFFKFQNLQNPFGVIFNPVSIEKLVLRAIENKSYYEEDIFQHNGIWKCFEVHSELSALDKNDFLNNLNSALQDLRQALFNATHILITYGTSWVYSNLGASAPLSDPKVVANCHKLPQQQFKKELLSIEAISNSIQNTVEKISKVNQNVTFVFTVSPVRHIKDGFAENSLSKAHLLVAIHANLNRQSKIVDLNSFYFPSFEIMMDELRDYRFYAEDMLHPNNTAIEIIWQKFLKVWVAPETESLQKEIHSVQNGLLHRPFNPESVEHLQFLKKLQQKIASLQQRFPHIRF